VEKMKTIVLNLLVVAGALLMIPGLADAHHGFAAFDKNAEVTLKGTVTDFHFVNPHCVVEFDVKDDKGQVQKWQGELTSPVHLNPSGWTPTSLEAGDQLTITGWPARNGVHSMWVTKVIANGKELKLGKGN
jgi:hypothetical protein